MGVHRLTISSLARPAVHHLVLLHPLLKPLPILCLGIGLVALSSLLLVLPLLVLPVVHCSADLITCQNELPRGMALILPDHRGRDLRSCPMEWIPRPLHCLRKFHYQ